MKRDRSRLIESVEPQVSADHVMGHRQTLSPVLPPGSRLDPHVCVQTSVVMNSRFRGTERIETESWKEIKGWC